jgi:hypothetical protein
MRKKIKTILSLIGILIFLSGCLRPLQADPLESDVPAFVPPTLIPATPTTEIIEPTSQNVNMTQAVACIDNLTFIQDETIPDGTIIKSGSIFEKKWEVKNSGTCNWGPGYSIRLIGGPSLEAPSPQDLFPARSGTSLSIQLEFTAPAEEGKYRSAWQAFNPDEIAFGDSFYIDFVVEE